MQLVKLHGVYSVTCQRKWPAPYAVVRGTKANMDLLITNVYLHIFFSLNSIHAKQKDDFTPDTI